MSCPNDRSGPPRRTVTPLLALLLATSATAQAPRSPTLLVDLDLSGNVPTRSSMPGPVRSSHGRSWFTASTPGRSRELWITDGTPAGTLRFDDPSPGEPAFYSDSVELPDGTLLASCWSSAVGGALYAAAPGTSRWTLLYDTGPIADSFAPQHLVLWNGECWFLADDGSDGSELWRTDGTVAGTRVVEDLPGLSNDGWTAVSEMLVTPSGLWIAEGRGTYRLFRKASPHIATVAVSDPTGSVQARALWGTTGNGSLLFVGRTVAQGDEVWITDGTTAGTVLLADIQPGASSATPRLLAAEPQRMWFYASTFPTGRELWITDGTTGGTRQVRDLWPGTGAGVGWHAVQAFGGLVFAGTDPNVGTEVFFSDGTAANTRLLVDILPGVGGSEPSGFALLGNRVWFQADDGRFGRELWSTDGTSAGTRREIDLRTGPEGSDPHAIGETAGGILLRADDGLTGAEPWVYDPVTGTAQPLGNLAPDPVNAGGGAHLLIAHETFALFVTYRAFARAECVATRGTLASTLLLPITPQRSPSELWVLGALPTGLVVQTMPQSANPPELRFTDGTVAGTRLIATGSALAPRGTRTGVQFQGRLWFRWDDGSGEALWITDGTASGTTRTPGFPTGTTFRPALVHDDRMWGTGQDAAHGREPWISDGTAAGTRRIADIAAGMADSDAWAFTPLGRRVFFRASAPATGQEPWVTDGTTAGTYLLADVSPGPSDGSGRLQASLGDRVVFSASHPSTGEEPWVTDGTVAGTRPLGDAVPGPDRGIESSGGLRRAGDRLLFISQPGIEDTVWATDGTPAGTVRLLDDASLGARILGGVLPVGDDGSFVFTADDPTHGRELWASDGTLAGTRIVTDSWAGPAAGNPSGYVRFGDGLLFQADDGSTGEELHRLPLADFGVAVAHTYGRGCGAHISADGTPGVGSSFTIRIDATPPGGAAGLVVGSGPAVDVRGPGCEINVQSPTALGNYATDAQGAARLTVAVPNDPALLGAHLHLQSVHLRTGGPLFGSLELTEGLELLVGD